MTAGANVEVDHDAVATGTAHVRGSTLLVLGRLISLGINFATQIIIARALGQSEFGAFALAFAVAAVGQVAITMGLHRGVTRFLTGDLERGDHPRFIGTVVLNVAVVACLGAVLVGFVAIAEGVLIRQGTLQPEAGGVLVVLILLAPINALDDLLIALFAIFDSPQAIFVRRYVLGPSLRLGVALLVVLAGGGVVELAIGYVAAGAFGIVLYGALFAQLLARRGILRAIAGRRLEIPAREVLGASVPLLSTDAVWLLINTFPIFVLTAVSGLSEVASYQVIRPAAALNLLVATSFHFLYLPLATRLANRGDTAAANEAYWRTTIWVAVLTFPVFAGAFAMGRPLAAFAFGERYEASGIYLSVLSIGYIVHASLGFNATTLAAHGRHRTVAAANALTAGISVATALLLIGPFGAFGAAAASTATLLAQTVLLQIGLWRQVGVALLHRDALRVYGLIAVTAGALFALEASGSGGPLTLLLIGLGWLWLVYTARHAMRIDSAFPGFQALMARGIVPAGRPGHRLAAAIDRLRSTRPGDAFRHRRLMRRWADERPGVQAAVYRSIWCEAANALDADVAEVALGTFEIRAGDRRVVISEHVVPLDPAEALRRARDRAAVSRSLRLAGLPVPDGMTFTPMDHASALAFLIDAGAPCVVKPAHHRVGRGTTANVRAPGDLLRTMLHADPDTELIIERQHTGILYRLLFLDLHLLDVLERRAPRVMGDGRSTVGMLIDAENARRIAARGREGLSLVTIDLDCRLTLAAAGLGLESIPRAGERVTVKTTTGQNAAVDNRTVQEAVGGDLLEEARKAVELVGLRLASLEVLTSEPSRSLAASGGVILDVDGTPAVHEHYLVDPAGGRRPIAIPILEALLRAAADSASEAGARPDHEGASPLEGRRLDAQPADV